MCVLWMVYSVGQALVYHLSDVKGMSLWPDKFGAVGLSQAATQDAVRMAGSFMLKARELQQLVFLFFYRIKQFTQNSFVASKRVQKTIQIRWFFMYVEEENITCHVNSQQLGQ